MLNAALVVHDEPALRGLLRLRLEQQGVRVLETMSGMPAVETFTRHMADIGVVVTGTRMGGESLLAAVRAVNPVVPVLFFTSSPPKQPLPPGVQVFGKPDQLNDLLRAVRDLIPAD